MRPGWNPIRRNKHVGTKANGHGSNNKLVIPESWHESKRFYECLKSYVLVTRAVGNRDLHFFVEPTKQNWFYPCTIDDICAILAHCPLDDISVFDFIVLRQPTRKQHILSPVWGRAIFSFDISSYSGTAIILEAQSLAPIIWGSSIRTEFSREIDRLRADGHEVCRTRRDIKIHVTPNSLRNTLLYRTLLHEIGHHIDYKRWSESEWCNRTRTEKEDYAYRYADKIFQTLQRKGIVPFKPIFSLQSFEKDRLSLDWFCPP